ncbi:hypothetical protein MMIC_P1991 [Mariprofundus micogutta]|uniref:Inner membrane protein n=1 Tax=Mariprofundus micogutta TaxID=1921010 RepID=A0A1L8CQ11_9PROT|nr:metal-dependent hydrolase [Mariprofundus micogutta]GAV21012.1 hypothetical protein MMIC_P1991 [Mariprofundus micogutta]
MASFQTHITVAAAGSLTASVICMEAGLVDSSQALVLSVVGSLAGILPDIDSDHSIPTRLVFNILSFAVALSITLIFQGQMNLLYLLGLALMGALCIRYVVYAIFARITEHRGLFHSVPAALLFGFTAFSLAHYLLALPLDFAWLLAAFVAGGYILHLLLDEFYSVNFIGASIKESFGSALTFFSRSSWFSYLLLYAAVGLAVYLLPLPRVIVSI